MVDWLIANGHAKTREEAVKVGEVSIEAYIVEKEGLLVKRLQNCSFCDKKPHIHTTF